MYYNKQLYTLKMLEEDTIANHIHTFHTLIDNSTNKKIKVSGNDSAIEV